MDAEVKTEDGMGRLSGREGLEFNLVVSSARHNMYSLTIIQIHCPAKGGKFT